MKLEDNFSRLMGRQVTDAERIQLHRQKDALGLSDNDALWLILMTNEAYKNQLKDIPAELAATAAKIRKEYQEITASAEAHAKATIGTAAAETLAPAAEKAFIRGVQKYTDHLERSARDKSVGMVALVGGLVLLIGAALGGGAVYLGHSISDNATVKLAKAEAAAATEAKVKAEAALEDAVAIAEARADAEIKSVRASAGWLGTREGQLAFKFFTKGHGILAATCEGNMHWEKMKSADGQNLCVPQRDGLLGWSSGSSGWVIP